MNETRGGEAESAVHEQLAAALLELEEYLPGSTDAFFRRGRLILSRARLNVPKSRESRP
jgi:hypothetical protein